MLNVDVAIKELNKVIVNVIDDTIKIADKYGIERNSLMKQMGEKIYMATDIGDFSTYQTIGLGVYLLGHYLERILIILHEIKEELGS